MNTSSKSSDLRSEVESYLHRHGWRAGEPGQYGELWRLPHRDVPQLAVPFEIAVGSRELAALAHRLSIEEQREQAEITRDLEEEFLDVQQYRIADTFVADDSVLLESASNVLISARKIVRAAATTARKPKGHIGANFSHPGDEIADKVRLSHTRRGSFVLPVVMPIEPPKVVTNQILGEDAEVPIESAERRVTRTLASALATLDSVAVKPAKEPKADDVMALIQSGVSRELVAAVRSIATDSGVHAFETTFRWAAGVGDPGPIPERILISDEASIILSKVERKLQRARPRLDQTVSGLIVEIRHLTGDPTGEISISTVRNNRPAEVRIKMSAEAVIEAADWFKAGRAVIAHGTVVATPGRPLQMPKPKAVRPMDELFIEGTDGS